MRKILKQHIIIQFTVWHPYLEQIKKYIPKQYNMYFKYKCLQGKKKKKAFIIQPFQFNLTYTGKANDG